MWASNDSMLKGQNFNHYVKAHANRHQQARYSTFTGVSFLHLHRQSLLAEEIIEELHEEEAASESFGEGRQSDHGALSRTSGNTLGESIVRPERADGSSKSSQ